MTPVVITLLIWLIGLLIMLSGRYLFYHMAKVRHHMKEEAKSEKFRDQSKSILLGIEERAIGVMPWYLVRLFLLIIGASIIALGFIAVGFWRL